MSAVSDGIASGQIIPPKKSLEEPFIAIAVDAEKAKIALAEFESERDE